MESPLISGNEGRRLEVLGQYGVPDTVPEETLDALTQLAAQCCQTPIGAVSFLDENREWFKSCWGISLAEITRPLSFCDHAIRQPGFFMVPDLRRDARFSHHPFVTGEPRITFYAAAPILTPAGQALGVLAVMDHVPRELRPDQQEGLRTLSRQVAAQLELSRRSRELKRLEAERDDLKEAVSEWRERERTYREMVEHANSIILRWTREGQITFLNKFGQEFFGYSLAEILGRHVVGTIVPETESTHRDLRSIMDQITANPHAFEQHINENMRRNGERVWIQWTNKTVLDPQGQVRELLSIGHDITDRQRFLEALHQSEVRYRCLFEHNPIPMLIFEPSTLQLLAVNEAFLNHYGYQCEEALTLRLTDLYPDDQKAKIAQLIPSLQGHANVGEWRHRKRDGSIITIVASSHDILYGERNARMAVMTDITERKRVEEELRAAQATLEERVLLRTTELAEAKERAESADRLKSAFLATMSHELRTPLNSIIGFTGIILQELAGPLNPEQIKQLRMVQGSARHLLALINDVLDISKIEAGQLEIRAEPFNLQASLERVITLVKPLAEKKGLELRLVLPGELREAVSDRLRVEQVLLNLLNNAVKFTERGTVTLEVALVEEFTTPRNRTPRPAARLSVIDTGIGIKAEDMEKLFQPFRQVDSGMTRQHEGTGLGLTICRRLAELLGGEVLARSTWGKGSEFTFLWPLHYTKEP